MKALYLILLFGTDTIEINECYYQEPFIDCGYLITDSEAIDLQDYSKVFISDPKDCIEL